MRTLLPSSAPASTCPAPANTNLLATIPTLPPLQPAAHSPSAVAGSSAFGLRPSLCAPQFPVSFRSPVPAINSPDSNMRSAAPPAKQSAAPTAPRAYHPRIPPKSARPRPQDSYSNSDIASPTPSPPPSHSAVLARSLRPLLDPTPTL